MNVLRVVSLPLDRRPVNHAATVALPGIARFVAACSEEARITSTIDRIAGQHHSGRRK
jgi:hypothetical protein